MTSLEDLEERYGHTWEFSTPAAWGVAAWRRRRCLTERDIAAGMLYALIGYDLAELRTKLAAQPDSATTLRRAAS